MRKNNTMFGVLAALAVAGCASTLSDAEVSQRTADIMKSSFQPKGQAQLDRLDQDEVQSVCSKVSEGMQLPRQAADKLESAQMQTVKFPADGRYLGDWREGEKIAQSGRGKQFSDNPKQAAGGNCYACHQLTKEEVSFGTLGPSLYGFAKLRGTSLDMQRYAWGKVYNPQAYTACSNMPRFGHAGILTEDQIRHVVALLMDPDSPVNK